MTTEEWGDAMSIIADGLSAVTEGCRLPVKMRHPGENGLPIETANNNGDSTEDWPKAEVLSIRNIDGLNQYYVHFVDYNKRLDEWVTEDRLDTRRIEPPTAKDEKATGINTPLRRTVSIATSCMSSRPSSPGPSTPAADSIVTGESYQSWNKIIIEIHHLPFRNNSISCSFTKEECTEKTRRAWRRIYVIW